MAKVMLVEDDKSMQELLSTLLNLEGFQVFTHEGHSQVSLPEFITLMKPDVLLMDVFLRENNGLDIIKSLRTNPAFKDIRVIMTSGSNLRQECINAGANAFIMKPFMPEELISTLNHQLLTTER